MAIRQVIIMLALLFPASLRHEILGGLFLQVAIFRAITHSTSTAQMSSHLSFTNQSLPPSFPTIQPPRTCLHWKSHL
jgi:hypothetical protein